MTKSFVENRMSELLNFTEFRLLSESLDSKWEMTLLPHTIVSGQDISRYDHEFGITDRKLYSVNDTDHITTYHRDGAIEIHHYDKNGTSNGIFKPGPANMKFAGTVFHHAMEHINAGTPVRFFAPNGDAIQKYHRMARVVSAKHVLDVSPIVPSSTGIEEIDSAASEFVVTKKRISHVGSIAEVYYPIFKEFE